MEKIKFTGRFPKMYCQVYPFHFAGRVKGRGYKAAFFDFVLPELEERFGSVFPESKGWQHFHRRKVKCRENLEFLLQKGDERIHFCFIYRDGKKKPEEELAVQLFAANMKKFLPVLAQPLTYTEIGPIVLDKKLTLVNENTLYTQCWESENATLIQKSLLAKIGGPDVKHKDPLELCYTEMHGEDTVFPEMLCSTKGTPYYDMKMAYQFTLSDIALRILRKLKDDNLVEMDQGKLRLVKKEKNPEFYVLKNVLDEDSNAEYELITREKENPMNGYVRKLDYFSNTKSTAFAFFTIKNKDGQEIFTTKLNREWGVLKKDLQHFIKEQKPLLRSMDKELKEKGSIAEEKKAELAELLGKFGEAVGKTRPNKPVIKKDRKKKAKHDRNSESMEALHVVLDFEEKLVIGGLTGKLVKKEDIEIAMKAARRLNEDEIYEFDLTDDIAFMKSVAKFMKTFSR